MSQISSRIAIKVKDVSVWERIKSLDLGRHNDIREKIDANAQLFSINGDWSVGPSLKNLVKKLIDAIGNEGVIIADQYDINVDPYSETYLGIGGKVYGKTYEITDFDPEVSSRYDIVDINILKFSEWINRGLILLDEDEVNILKSLGIEYTTEVKKTKPKGVDTAKPIIETGGGSEFVIKNGCLKKYKGTSLKVYIPEGITTVGKGAFKGNKSIVSVEIPEGVIVIEEEAFRNCINLKSISIPDTVTIVEQYAFEGSGLTEISLPENADIMAGAFCACKGLADKDGFIILRPGTLHSYVGTNKDVIIPDGITTIEDWAFRDSESLQSIIFPNGITNIGEGAFAFCKELKQIIIPEGVTEIKQKTFSSCKSLRTIEIPDSVLTVGDDAFSFCYMLRSVTFPTDLKSIGKSAFQFCQRLNKVVIPENTEIGSGAFHGCEELADDNGFVIVNGVIFHYFGNDTEISIPKGKGITTISESAFSKHFGLENLQRVDIPEGITTIGRRAFENLKNLYSVVIPNTVTRIDEWAFLDCHSLRDISVPENANVGSRAFGGCKLLADEKGFVIKNHIVFGFFGDTTEASIPEGTTSISSAAFYQCNTLKTVRIPESVTRIDGEAFVRCDELESLVIPESVTEIGEDPIVGCENLKKENLILPAGFKAKKNDRRGFAIIPKR